MEQPFWTPLLAPSPRSKKKKAFGVVPRSRAHIMEASDCVFELFGWRTVTRPVAKNRLPYFVPKTPGYTLFCQLANFEAQNFLETRGNFTRKFWDYLMIELKSVPFPSTG